MHIIDHHNIDVTVLYSVPVSPIGGCLPGSRPLVLNSANGTITTPFFGTAYPAYCTCAWRIDSPDENEVSSNDL